MSASIEDKQQEIIDEFASFDDWMDKYEYIIELGKDCPTIERCQSRVWLDSTVADGKMHFSADSDAIITKGIIGLLIRVLNDEKPEDVASTDLHFIRDIGLQEHLSPTRANGLASMVKRMKIEALKHVN
jgi:cysteine desulfuration protein SufE